MTETNEQPSNAIESSTLLAGFIEQPLPETGSVNINRIEAEKNFGASRITQHGGNFRAYSSLYKVTISAEDAAWIINKLKLSPEMSGTFSRSITWS